MELEHREDRTPSVTQTTCRGCGATITARVIDDDEVRDECESCLKDAAETAASKQSARQADLRPYEDMFGETYIRGLRWLADHPEAAGATAGTDQNDET